FGEAEIAACLEAYRLVGCDTGEVVHYTNRQVTNAREIEAPDIGGNHTYVMRTLAEPEIAIATQSQLVHGDGRASFLRRASDGIDSKYQTVADLVVFVLAVRVFERKVALQVEFATCGQRHVVLKSRAFAN